MTQEEHTELGPEELDQQQAELLPDREQMTVVQPSGQLCGGGFTLPVVPPSAE